MPQYGEDREVISKLLELELIVCARCLVFLAMHGSFAFCFLFFLFLYFFLLYYLGSFSALTHHGLQAQKEENDLERVDEARLASSHCASSIALYAWRVSESWDPHEKIVGIIGTGD
jgi:cell division protein FtsB